MRRFNVNVKFRSLLLKEMTQSRGQGGAKNKEEEKVKTESRRNKTKQNRIFEWKVEKKEAVASLLCMVQERARFRLMTLERNKCLRIKQCQQKSQGWTCFRV